ncbi:MAG: threonylcarbamoyl-AMP synthase [Flavobacteriales bacterium]|nr:threonylcarbamoyl-AMP synthase [Flavobacteriales bacterium]
METQIVTAVSHLENGDNIIYPTETVWALGCDATNEAAVDRLSKLKGRAPDKGYVLLVDGLEMLAEYVGHITPALSSIVSSSTPTTVVFPEHQLLPPNVLASDHTIGIRITHSRFCKQLIRAFGKPIVSTSANYRDQAPPSNFEDLDQNLLSAVQYVINLDEPELMSQKPSRIVRILPGGGIETIR